MPASWRICRRLDSGSLAGERSHSREGRVAVPALARCPLDQGRHLALQAIDSRVGMCPGVGEGGLVERPDPLGGVWPVEQRRARRYQQPDREVHRVHVLDQPLLLDEVEQRQVVGSLPAWSRG